MNAFVRSARGASAFTSPDDCHTRPLAEVGLLSPEGEPSPARTWQQLIDDLLRIRKLEDDWDGQGAEAPHPSLVDGAITLAQYLRTNGASPATRVIAGVNGTVFLEWHTPDGFREIEVVTPDEAECRWVRKGSDDAEVGIFRRS